MNVSGVVKGAIGRKGKGWIKNLPDRRDAGHLYTPRGPHRRALALYGSRLKASNRPTLREYAPPIYRQSATGSCVGQAKKRVIVTTMALCGLPLGPENEPSARAIYKMGRNPDHIDHVDAGSRPRTVSMVVRRHGAPTEKDVPWSVSKINDDFDSNALMNGFEFAGLEFEHIFERGEELGKAVDVATREDLCPVEFGILVPRSFDAHNGEHTYNPIDLRADDPGHMMVAYAVDWVNRRVLIANSWGRGWGFGGWAWVSLDWFIANARDVQVTRSWAGLEKVAA